MRWHRLVCAVMAVVAVAGCWNRREIETLGFVTLAGVDYDPDRRLWEVTVHVARTRLLGREAGGGPAETPPQHVHSASGSTFFEAVRLAALAVPPAHRLWWGHVQAIVFGDAATRQGIEGPLDWFSRDGEMRRIVWVDVTPGQARDLLQARVPSDNLAGLNVTDLHKARDATSTAQAVRLHEFLIALDSSVAPTVGVLWAEAASGQENRYRMEGAAVFRGYRLVGYLDGTETRGLLWTQGKVKSGILAVPCPGGGLAGLEIVQARGGMRPALDPRGQPSVAVWAEAELHLGDRNCPSTLATPEEWDQLERAAADRIRAEVQAALDKARALHADVFGFGEAIGRRYPALWRQLALDWHDRGFLALPVEVTAQALVRRSGLSFLPTRPGSR